MREQHTQLGQALGACRTHVVLADLFEEDGAVPAAAGTDAARHTDDDGQHHELDAVDPARIARDGHQVPQLADQELPADDVEQAGHRHQHHAQCHARRIQRGSAEQGHQQREADIHDQTDEKSRQRDGQARTHACEYLAADIAPIVGVAKIEYEHAGRLLPEDGVGDLARAVGMAIEHQRLVVTVLLFPALDGFRRHALDAELHARHVVRRVHHEEQREGEQVHPDEDRHCVKDAANEVGDHEWPYCKGKQ